MIDIECRVKITDFGLAKALKEDRVETLSADEFCYLHNHAPVPQICSPLFTVVARCLQKDPERRYSDVSALR